MKFSQATARRIGVAVIVAGSLALTSCAAGQHAATARQTPPIDAIDGNVGDIALRGVAIVAPGGGESAYQAGSSAPLTVVIVNNGTFSDTLTKISTPAASSWAYFADAAAGSAVASGSPTATSGATASPSAIASPTATATATAPAATASATTAPGTSTGSGVATPPAGAASVEIPGGRSTSFGVPSSKGALLLLGLSNQLYTASSVPVTFTFAKAGSITLNVPVQVSTSPGSSTVPAPSGEEHGAE